MAEITNSDIIEEAVKEMLAGRNAAEAEKERKESAWDAMIEFLKDNDQEDLFEEYIEAESMLKEAKKAAKEREEELRQVVLSAAAYQSENGVSSFGRTFHKNINVVRANCISFDESCLPDIVRWLVEHQKRDLISIKTHGSTNWFLDMVKRGVVPRTPSALSPAVTVSVEPDVKLDSHAKWSK